MSKACPEMEQRAIDLLQLPEEILENIVKNLDVEDILNLSYIDKFFSKFLPDDVYYERYLKMEINEEGEESEYRVHHYKSSNVLTNMHFEDLDREGLEAHFGDWSLDDYQRENPDDNSQKDLCYEKNDFL